MKFPNFLHNDRLPTPALLLLAFCALLLVSRNLGINDLVAGDEGYYGVMARNVEHGMHFIANPSLTPLGEPGDKPFLYPVLLSFALRIGGIGEVPPE